MSFDDYNYDLYNKYILIDPNHDEQSDSKVETNGAHSQKAPTN